MSAAPTISIIVPVYNVAPYLPQCLDSLIHQTLRDIEIICVDDGSTDGSADILARYAENDERIRVLTQANAGLSAARNSGLDIASAPYIMFCDSDDWYEPNMCKLMLASIEEHPSADIAICGYHSKWERPREENEPESWQEKVPFIGYRRMSKQVIRECLIGAPFKIYRRKLIEEHTPRFPRGLRYEDCFFWYVYAAYSRGIVFVAAQLYNYRLRASSIMSNAYKKNASQNIDYIRVSLLLWNYFKEHNLQNLWGGFIADMIGEQIKNALLYSTEADAQTNIIPRVREFVLHECREKGGYVSPLLFRALAASLLQPVARKKSLGGLLSSRYTLSQITIRLCGIPLSRLRFYEDSLTWYILGIPCRREKGQFASLLAAYTERLYSPFIPKINSQYSLSLKPSPSEQGCIISSS